VHITLESDWERARTLLHEIVDRLDAPVLPEAEQGAARSLSRFPIKYSSLTPIIYTTVQRDNITLTVRYLCQPRNRRGSANDIWLAILSAFRHEADIAFAYPTQRFTPEGGHPADHSGLASRS
jgi:hypothetical protein